MRKLLLILVILFSVILQAIESDPSDVVGYVKFTCLATATSDINSISIPMNCDFSTASELGAAYPTINTISKWNAADQAWLTAVFTGDEWIGDFELEECHSYLINVTADTEVIISGTIATEPTLSLVTTSTSNLNLIMHPLSKSDLTMASSLGNDVSSCNTVSYWSVAEQAWITATFADNEWIGDFAIETTQVLMLNVEENGQWPQRNSSSSSDSKKLINARE